MLAEDWVEKEFPFDPFVQCGRADGLTPLQTIALFSLAGTLRGYDAILKDTVLDLYLAQSPIPAINVRPAKVRGLGVSIITLGLLNLVGALAARMAMIVTRPKGFPFLKLSLGESRAKPFDETSIIEFDLSDAKRKATGLYPAAISADLLQLSGDRQHVFLEIFCAALEFMILHEGSHVSLRHREARNFFDDSQRFTRSFDQLGLINWDNLPENDRYRTNLRMTRCFEHQADFHALRCMVMLAPKRPQAPDSYKGTWSKHVFRQNSSRRYLAIVGAGVAFAAVTLMQAEESDGPLTPRERSSAHPIAHYRLKVAVGLLSMWLKGPITRAIAWPSMLLVDYDKRLLWAETITTAASTAILFPNYLEEYAKPGKDWNRWRRKAVLDVDPEVYLWPGFEVDMQRASDIVGKVKGHWIPDAEA